MDNPLNPLTDLEQTIREHWQTHRPKMYADLEAHGILDNVIYEAAQRTRDAVLQLTDQGMELLTAWEVIREEWAILPDEDDEPEASFPPEDAEDDWTIAADDDGEWLKRYPSASEALE